MEQNPIFSSNSECTAFFCVQTRARTTTTQLLGRVQRHSSSPPRKSSPPPPSPQGCRLQFRRRCRKTGRPRATHTSPSLIAGPPPPLMEGRGEEGVGAPSALKLESARLFCCFLRQIRGAKVDLIGNLYLLAARS